MLFDLRGRGRRRAVKVDLPGARPPHGRRPGAVRHRRRRPAAACSTRSARTAGQREQRASSRSASSAPRSSVQAQPTDAARLGRARRACATSWPARATATTRTTGDFTDEGQRELRARRHGVGAPPRRSPRQARRRTSPAIMVQALTATGSTSPTRRSTAQEIVVDGPATDAASGDYAQLADLAYARRPDPQGRPRGRQGDRARAQGRPRAGQGPARRGQAAGAAARGRRGRRRPSPPRRADAAEAADPGPDARSLSSRPAPVAQLAEQRTLNPKVEGSIPSGGTAESPATAGLSPFSRAFHAGRRCPRPVPNGGAEAERDDRPVSGPVFRVERKRGCCVAA